MRLTRQQLRELILEASKKKEVPSHFGSGKNIKVFNYRTKNFDICGSAVKLFQKLSKDKENKKSIKKAAQISDQIFSIEKDVVDKEKASDTQINRARKLQKELIKIIKRVDKKPSINYMKMHMNEIEKRRGKK